LLYVTLYTVVLKTVNRCWPHLCRQRPAVTGRDLGHRLYPATRPRTGVARMAHRGLSYRDRCPGGLYLVAAPGPTAGLGRVDAAGALYHSQLPLGRRLSLHAWLRRVLGQPADHALSAVGRGHQCPKCRVADVTDGRCIGKLGTTYGPTDRPPATRSDFQDRVQLHDHLDG